MQVSAIYISEAHNFFGRYGKQAGQNPTRSVSEVECVAGRGLRGDRFLDYKRNYAGQISFFDEAVHRTLLQELRPKPCSTAAYRRNVITRGVGLSTLIGQEFALQGVRFLGIAESKPCYWMEQAVGIGAEHFLRGRGGLRAKILDDGILRVDCANEAGLLLAGGRSRRMGCDKATLNWNGHTLGDHQATTLAESGAWPLLLSCREDQMWCPEGYVRVEDRTTEGGVVGAIANAYTVTEADVLTVLAIDLPKVIPGLLQRIAGIAREEQKSVVPLHENRFEPLVAAWHRSALPALQQAAMGNSSLQDVCATLRDKGRLRAFELRADEIGQLVNLNTPADLVRLG